MKRKHLLLLFISALLVITFLLLFVTIEVEVLYTLGWIGLVLILLYFGNIFISNQFDRYFPWLKFGGVRLFTHLILGVLYSLVVINLSYLLFKSLLTVNPPTTDQLVVMNAYGVVIFIPIYSIYFSYQFLIHWRKSELASEQFKKEHLKSQLDSLKNHLDPHFLFNNLNILSSLIDKDKALSKQFLDKFAEVYRSILKSKEEDLITLEEELEFIKAYLFLVQIRFENIELTIDIPQSLMDQSLPPLTLQMLIENALKHNVVSEKKPLKITIDSKGGNELCIINTLNPKPFDEAPSGSGIDNIRKRYLYFTEKEVKVSRTIDYFEVCVPLISIETI